jgi:CRISPR-associated endonuclease Csn1
LPIIAIDVNVRSNFVLEARLMPIRGELILGIDLGIGSCGWAVIRETDGRGTIVALGARTFDVPETDKERKPKNQIRRQYRGMRRVLRRRAQRMKDIRRLFHSAGMIESDCKDALKGNGVDPWRLRSEGLDRRLSGSEFAMALGHIAKHRGFRSNSKRDRGANTPKESSEMLKTIETTRERLRNFRTIGEAFANDPEFAARKRNREGDFSRSILRDDQENEVRLLFDRQRRFGGEFSDEELEGQFIKIAFSQRPLADSEDKVGFCPFEPTEKRAARRSPSLELFRLLTRVSALRVQSGKAERSLTPEEINLAVDDFGSQRGLTFKRLRKLIGLNDTARFSGILIEDEGKRDVVARAGDAMAGSYTLRKILGEAGWNSLRGAPAKLDAITFVVSFREDIGSISAGLGELGLEPLIVATLMQGVEQGDFSEFKKSGHISAKACRALIPHLKTGSDYSAACKAAGYDHAKPRAIDLDQIANPIARKALTEGVKQVRAIIQKYGLPDRIHIELARDVGKSIEERKEIESGIEKRNKQKDWLRLEFANVVGVEPKSAEDLLRFELWREQNGRCLYTDRCIHPNAIVASDNSVQVDHILPWSRSGDDSFINKTLCFAGANQEKRDRTPFEWFGAEEARWNSFVASIETNKAMKGRKKRNYVLKDASILEGKFRPRNLGDTRYATRLLAMTLARMYPAEGERHIFARPGALTDRLRRGWGVQGLKKDADGRRISDDRHHALDALIVAATTESALQSLTKAFQDAERAGSHRDFSRLDPPWPGFLEETNKAMAEVFISRAERRRARGKAHDATIRQFEEHDGIATIYERKSVDVLTERDLVRVKDQERNHKLIESLREWIVAGKPKDRRPLSPKGDPISKVRLSTNKKPDVPVRDGAADRGEMVRVDVFRKKNRRDSWEYYLVPIYPHQVANLAEWPQPPHQAVQQGRDETNWPSIDHSYGFLFSIFHMSFIRLIKSDGEIIEGYFRGLDRDTGAIKLSHQQSNEMTRKGIGTRTLHDFRKYSIDRLGGRFEVKQEKRTWHGAVCT